MAVAIISSSSTITGDSPLRLRSDDTPQPSSRSSSAHIAWSYSKQIHPGPLSLRPTRTDPDLTLADVESPSTDGDETWKSLDNIAALGLTLTNDGDEDYASDESLSLSMAEPTDRPPSSLWDHDSDEDEPDDTEASNPPLGPFHRWMRTIQRRAHHPGTLDNGGIEPFPEYSLGGALTSGGGHRKSSSGSSFGFVAAVRSASASLAGTSVVTRPRRNTGRSSNFTRTDRGSRTSASARRDSEDSNYLDQPLSWDPAVSDRLLRRRRILEELIKTEESYIGDIKFLMNVYVTILASLPSPHAGLRSSINRNLTGIVELHEEILGELHRIVPHSEFSLSERVTTDSGQHGKHHHRWHSLGSVPEHKNGRPPVQDASGMTAEPSIAADVARVFGRRMNRFFVYEEYGAKYEMMIKDVAAAHRNLPDWETYQKGLEALAASLGSTNLHLDHSKKSLTIGDLLVKPIQRICRYPLLFSELLKQTPVYDCPNSHMELENVLIRLREATAEINQATDNPGMKATIEKTWLLQDRLVFPNQKMDAVAKTKIRSLGQVRLCGALHVCWQTGDGVKGQYMVSMLYKDCLCLATAGRFDQTYTIRACIGLGRVRIEEVDNGRGLQCHTAPFSWKVVFECDHELYEMLMTACSAKEETEWRRLLSTPESGPNPNPIAESNFQNSIFLNVKSLGTVFGKPGTIARRVSIHRATTVGPKSPLNQVIIKNTSAAKEDRPLSPPSPINRSQSLYTTNSRIPVLAPSQGDRARLETQLSDVWSRDVLPYPGMSSRTKSDYLMRSSASTMMRRLSVASITHSFSKRSASTASISKPFDDGPPQISTLDVTGGDLDCDHFSFVSEAATTDSKKRLPVIQDEPEQTSNNNSSSSTCLDTDEMLRGTMRRLDNTLLSPQWFIEDEGFGSPALRTASVNSLKMQAAASPKPGSPPQSMSEKENVSGRPKMFGNGTTLSRAKSTSKWTRVKDMNRGLKASGIRSFFR